MPSFKDAYIAGDTAVTSLFEKSLDSIYDSPPEARPWDPELIKAMRQFNARFDHHPPFKGNEAVVITGQQPAIFGGPLYSVYKAITTIKLADKISATHNIPCVPIFWVGSEDHDYEEAATIHYPDKDHKVQKVTLTPHSDQQDKALYEIELPGQIHELIDTLSDASLPGEFRDAIQSYLHESARNADSLSDWSTHLLVKLFQNTPLVFFAPHLHEARLASIPIIQKAIQNPLEVTQCVNQGAQAIQAIGYTPQVEKNPEECSFFLELSGIRQKVIYSNNTFHLPGLAQDYTESDLLAMLENNPETFSPNVALRCIVQQHLFPVMAYVAGPGELSYWGQFKSIFNRYNLPMPVVYPRVEVLLISKKLCQHLDTYSLKISDLSRSENDLIDSALRTATENQALINTASMRAELNPMLESWTKQLEEDSPVPNSMAANLHTEINRKLDRLERVILHIDTEKSDTVRRHIQRLYTQLNPNKKPQERVYTVYSFLFNHGWGLMDTLMQEIEIESFNINEVEL